MKTSLLKNVLMASLVFVSAGSALARTSQKISIDHLRYEGTLVEVAQAVDQALSGKAAKVCGSIQDVERLDDVNFILPMLRAFNVNAQGVEGPTFIFAYPRVQATAVVVCK